jgi:hypothetical protein
VRGIDGNGTGGATSHYRFTVDTTAPGAPAAASAVYPSDAWAGGAQVTGTFPLDVTEYQVRGLSKMGGLLKMKPRIEVRLTLRFEAGG